MPLEPPLGRALLRSLFVATRHFEAELSRCDALRVRELSQLKSATGAALPRDLRGLLDARVAVKPHPGGLHRLVGLLARRVSEASLAPGLDSLDADAGFAALRHLHDRVAALRALVYRTRSAAARHGIRVEAASSFHGVERDRFFFRYQIRMANQSARRVRLLSRAWTVRDLDGRATDVQGPGVVGVFPTLGPGDEYEYSSGVPLSTPVGTQSGHFVFVIVNEDGSIGDVEDNVLKAARDGVPEELAVGKTVVVPVAPFSYRSPTMDERVKTGTESDLQPSVKRSRRKRRR